MTPDHQVTSGKMVKDFNDADNTIDGQTLINGYKSPHIRRRTVKSKT